MRQRESSARLPACFVRPRTRRIATSVLPRKVRFIGALETYPEIGGHAIAAETKGGREP